MIYFITPKYFVITCQFSGRSYFIDLCLVSKLYRQSEILERYFDGEDLQILQAGWKKMYNQSVFEVH